MSDSRLNSIKKSMLLYAVTDRSWLGDNKTLYGECEKAIKGGITLLQLREKHLSNEEFIKEGFKIKELCKKNNVKLIINDNVEVMLALDADGVHIGQEDGDGRKVRDLIGPDKILGISTQTVEQSIKAIEDGADYLGVGAVFSTSTKTDAIDVSFETLKEITRISSVATCAIGGISYDNIKKLNNSGINGCAIVSAIFNSDDAISSTKQLKKECDKAFFKYNASTYIFDLDGTLIDSLGIWSNLASSYLKEKDVLVKDDVDKIIKNFSLEESSQYLKTNYGLSESVATIREEIVGKIYDLYAHSIKLKSGVKKYIESLYNKGVTLTIASASTQSLVEAVLKNNNIDKYFSLIKTEMEVGISKAKSSKVFDSIVEELSLSKDDVVVFEDSYAAIKTLKANGYYTVGVFDEHNKNDVDQICDYYIKEFGEI